MRVDKRMRFEYANVWAGKFLNPGRKFFGLKNIRIREWTGPNLKYLG